MAFIDDLITALKNEFETFIPLFDDLSFEDMSLSNFERNIWLLRSRATALLNCKAIALSRNISFDISITSFVSRSFDISLSNQIAKMLEAGIDEEWRAVISEQKYEWSKSGLTERQVDNNVMFSLIDLHWGRFKSWMQLLRILSWIQSQLTYK